MKKNKFKYNLDKTQLNKHVVNLTTNRVSYTETRFYICRAALAVIENRLDAKDEPGLDQWDVMITNVPEDMLEVKMICEIY